MVKKIATQKFEDKIIEMLPRLNGKKVLVVGDVGVDEYVTGHVHRISPEAPVPVLEVEHEDCRLGLSANVAQNIKSLGGQPFLVSVIGSDPGATALKKMLKESDILVDYLIVDSSRSTTRKTRVMAQHHHLVRVDYETKQVLSQELSQRLLGQVLKLIPQIDIVILQDYAKGVISAAIVEEIVSLAHRHDKKVLMDPHRYQPLATYKGVDLLKPNFEEALALLNLSYDDYKMQKRSVEELGEILRVQSDSKWVILTQGKEGMTIFDGGSALNVPTFARQVFDVTGAGDTVIAALGVSLAGGLTIEESCVLANIAAGVVVGKIGCVPCQRSEIIEYIEDYGLR